MKLRIARHVSKLDEMIHFYAELLGMKILGSFQNHSGYDGVFLGYENQDWHLEFTASASVPIHHFDEDDLLVFYFEDEVQLNQMKNKLLENNIIQQKPKNPYWKENGYLFLDPQGYGIMITLKRN